MITGQQARREEAYTELFDVLTDGTRRRIIRIVRGQSGSITEQQLLDRLTSDTDSDLEPETGQTSQFIPLYHVHLPKLAEAGIVEWDRSAETVTATEHPVSEIDRLEQRISSKGWGSIASALADTRRRQALSIIESASDRITYEELTNELRRRETSGQNSNRQELRMQLHHHHLPKLEAVGLVEYDHDESVVSYRGPATLRSVLPEAAEDPQPAASE